MIELNVAEIYASRLNQSLIISVHIAYGQVAEVVLWNDFEKAKQDAIDFWNSAENRFDMDVDNTQLWDMNGVMLWSYLDYHMDPENAVEPAEDILAPLFEVVEEVAVPEQAEATPDIDSDFVEDNRYLEELSRMYAEIESIDEYRPPRHGYSITVPTAIRYAGRMQRRPRI